MKKSIEKKMKDFEEFFGNMKVDVERDLKWCVQLNPVDMTLPHIRQCFEASEHLMDKTFLQVHGALFFLYVMGYITEDEYFPKDSEVASYFDRKKQEYDSAYDSIIRQRLEIMDKESESAC